MVDALGSSGSYLGVKVLLDVLDNLDMYSVLKIALETNEKALKSYNRYNAKITLPKLNEYYLGQFDAHCCL